MCETAYRGKHLISLDKKDIAILPTERHAVFLEHVLNAERIDVAGKKAGFACPARDAYEILTKPEVQRMMRNKVRGRAETEGLVVCYQYLLEVVRDKSQTTKVRVDAAKFIYGHHMPAVKALEGKPEGDKPIEEMTNDELRRFIEDSETQLANRAKDVTPTPAPRQTIEDIL